MKETLVFLLAPRADARIPPPPPHFGCGATRGCTPRALCARRVSRPAALSLAGAELPERLPRLPGAPEVPDPGPGRLLRQHGGRDAAWIRRPEPPGSPVAAATSAGAGGAPASSRAPPAACARPQPGWAPRGRGEQRPAAGGTGAGRDRGTERDAPPRSPVSVRALCPGLLRLQQRPPSGARSSA